MGTKHLTSESATKLGLIGAGTQGIYQVLFACHCRPITDVYITTRSLEKLDTYINILKKERPDITFHKVASSEDVVKNAEIIITATSSMTPVLPENRDLYTGKTFIAIGSYQPTMRELPNALIETADEIYVDIDYAKEESGDLYLPLQSKLISEDKIFTIGELIHGTKKAPSGNQTILYKSVGMALFDVLVGEKILACADQKKIGQTLNQ